MPTQRQVQISRLLQRAMTDVFQKTGYNYYGSAMVTVMHVWLNTGHSLARFYLSIYNVGNANELIDIIKDNTKEIRMDLAAEIRHSMRKIPEIEFYLDDLVDESFKVEALLNELNKPKGLKD